MKQNKNVCYFLCTFDTLVISYYLYNHLSMLIKKNVYFLEIDKETQTIGMLKKYFTIRITLYP